MKNIFVLGDGFISSHFNYPKILDRLEFNSNQIETIIDKYKPDVLINCIAKAGILNTDWCEDNKEITSLTNTTLPIMLTDICSKKSIQFIHIGTGDVFNGESPIDDYSSGWKENDIANPLSYYAKTKYACDLALDGMKNVVILRIRLPISTKNHPRNLINKLISYPQIIGLQNSFTFMDDFVKCVDKVIEKELIGIYHVTNFGKISAADIMKEYRKYFPKHKFEIIYACGKHSFCILNTNKLNSAGIYMRPANEALKDCMLQYVNAKVIKIIY